MLVEVCLLYTSGKAVGYHYEGIEGTSGNVIPGTESSVNNIGVYKAQVEGYTRRNLPECCYGNAP